jgi:hypothetical protein
MRHEKRREERFDEELTAAGAERYERGRVKPLS